MAHILVVDDDLPVLRTIARVLEADGHRVRTAPGAREALRAFAAEPAELVMVDIHMPDMDGIEFIRQFRQEVPDTPVIAMSGGSDFMLHDLGLEASRRLGVAVTLAKPPSREQLREAIARALGED